MSRELTKKQRGFIRDYIKTGNATLAAANHYDIESTRDKDNVAATIGKENIRKPQIRLELNSFLNRYKEELYEIQEAMKLKDKNEERYSVLAEAADKMQKQIQLLSGDATENINVRPIYNGMSRREV